MTSYCLCRDKLHLPTPKSHYAEDIVYRRDVPIFCTSEDELVNFRGGVADFCETEMMQVQLKVVSFNAQIPSTEQVDILLCPCCFAEFICGCEGSVAAN